MNSPAARKAVSYMISKDTSSNALEARVTTCGHSLRQTLLGMLETISSSTKGPQALAAELGVDKVLTSRVLKAIRFKDPVAVIFHAPGPEPLRRLVKAAQKKGAPDDECQETLSAINRFEQLINQEAGDRSSLDAILCAWLPETRRDFELRRKQTAFKAISHLKGSMADTILASVFLHPSNDREHIDIVWLFGFSGFHRLRPGVVTKLATRRYTKDGDPRVPVNLKGHPIHRVEDARLDEFCDAPPAPIEVHRVGDVVQYRLGGNGFGPRSTVDLILVEVNYSEMPRYVNPDEKRKGYVFAEVNTPAKALLFDVFVHEDIYPGSEPQLIIYDTAFEGVADVNDRTRDVDRLPLSEAIQNLGKGVETGRNSKIPDYLGMLRHVVRELEWDASEFRGYRFATKYPFYGSQVTMAFDPPSR